VNVNLSLVYIYTPAMQGFGGALQLIDPTDGRVLSQTPVQSVLAKVPTATSGQNLDVTV
jgi:hypothetical protein